MIRIILYIYVYTIRSFFTWLYNRIYHGKILALENFKDYIRHIYFSLAHTNSEEELIKVYHEIYQGYVLDGDYFFSDWTPSFHTMIFKIEDDCDGMAIVGKYVLKEFCRIKNLKYKYINMYSFAYIKLLNKSHAMTVLKIKTNDYYLFDYGKILHLKNKNLLKRYYISHYLDKKFKSISAKKIYMIRLPEPRGIKRFERKE